MKSISILKEEVVTKKVELFIPHIDLSSGKLDCVLRGSVTLCNTFNPKCSECIYWGGNFQHLLDKV